MRDTYGHLSVNGLQAGNTKTGFKMNTVAPKRVMRRSSRMKGNFHVRFREKKERVIAPFYSGNRDKPKNMRKSITL